ncbi:ribokinase [Cryobacterium sp. MDB1-18-2]|uniref:Ribokinase n=1 Tax=Cryobacterium glucosi TaxID=1259175 RepID=A0ABY2IMH5_9MICO|nr:MULTISPECIES: ribokinase [Cryobacterium]MEB0003415.1 ribokinase [Cryobacterium sp. RTC2.1]MEB0287798.1 ribokinase [Cryobacterium sp. 10S3]MEB0306827.1 ribokinase [Cryobacterium sp. 10I1]TFC18267.1 ribokinase [Cryobacterium glucosi]TFC24258.1 ribokinase [Cryobacterium sp. MDB1-18-2]
MSSFTPTADGGPIVVVGSINVDQLMVVERHPAPGETLIARSMEFLPGGKGANQAVAAARLGAHVSLVGATGSDSVAGLTMALLERAGVDLSAVSAIDGPTGLALVTVADDGENTIVVVPGANAAVGADVVGDAADLIARAAVVVLQGEIPAAGIEAAVRLATGRVVLNLAPVIAVDPATIRRADPLVVNEHEAALVLALVDPGTDIPRGDAELVARLRAWGVPAVVLTRGEQGAICSDSLGTTTVPSPRVAAVDSSGAGDAFVGALSGRLAAGSSLLDAVRLAVRVGAFAVRTLGTQQSYPGADDELPEVEK